MSTTNTSTAIAVFEEITNILAPFPSDKFRHLVPTTLQARSDLYRPSATVVMVDASDGRQVYPTPGSKDGSLCLHSLALERIGNAAGIDFDPRLTRHIHDVVNQPLICEYIVGGWYTDSLGQRRMISRGAKADLRDGSVSARLLGGGLGVARQFVCERTESRARNRVIRATTNLPSSFSRAELALPMVAVRWRLDERDPDVRRALIARGTAAADAVFDGVIHGTPDIDPVSESEEAAIAAAATRVEAEPDVPDDAPAAAAAPTAPPATTVVTPEDAITAIAARTANVVRRRAAGERETPATDDDVKAIGIAVRDVLALRDRVAQPRWKDVRLAVVRVLFGVGSTRDMTVAQARVFIAMSKDPAGQKEIAAAWAFVADRDPALADVRDALR